MLLVQDRATINVQRCTVAGRYCMAWGGKNGEVHQAASLDPLAIDLGARMRAYYIEGIGRAYRNNRTVWSSLSIFGHFACRRIA